MIPVEKRKKYNTVLISFVYVTIIHIAIRLTVGFHFFATDDFWLAQIYSGRITGTQETMPMFNSWIFSFIMSSLYKLNSNIGWYSWLLIFLSWLANAVILLCFITETKNLGKYGVILGIIVYSLLYFSFYLYFSVHLTFTTTTAVCTSPVVIMILSEKKAKKGKDKLLYNIILGIFTVFSLIMRWEMVLVTVAVYIGAYIVIALTSKRKKDLFFPLLVITVVSLVSISNETMIDKSWNDTIEKQKNIAQWVDYVHLPYNENEDLYNEVNWTEAEYNMAEVYMMLDKDFSSESFEVLNNASKQEKESVLFRIKQNLSIVLFQSGVDKYIVLAAIALTFTACVFCLLGEDRKMIFAPLCYFAGFVVLFLYILSTGRFLKHAVTAVYILALVPLCYCTLRTVIANWPAATTKSVKYIKYIFILGCMAILLAISYSEIVATYSMVNDVGRRQENEYITKVNDYVCENKDNVYLMIPLAITYCDPEPLYQKDIQHPTNSICIIGWTTQTPIFTKQLNLCGIDKLTKETFFEDNVYIIHGTKFPVKSWETYTKMLLDYIKDDYPGAKLETVFVLDGFNICKIVK